jgi:mRNA interferase MazF
LSEAPLFRLEVHPTPANGLARTSHLMVEKLITVPANKIGKHVGELDDESMARLSRALIVFLGLAGRSSR